MHLSYNAEIHTYRKLSFRYTFTSTKHPCKISHYGKVFVTKILERILFNPHSYTS